MPNLSAAACSASPGHPQLVEDLLKRLTLWDKKDNKIMMLSGGMKRRVMIAKALSHEPAVLFLDEPTAGVDVELRRDMWDAMRDLKDKGVTIILTTHYIEEAEEMADRIGVINKGQLMLVEEKAELMRKLGKKELTLQLQEPLAYLPEALSNYPLEIKGQGLELVYTYDTQNWLRTPSPGWTAGLAAEGSASSRTCRPSRARLKKDLRPAWCRALGEAAA